MNIKENSQFGILEQMRQILWSYSAIPVLVDAAFKNLTSISDQSIFKSIKESSSKYFEPGIKEILELGYIPADYMVESVAKQMEY